VATRETKSGEVVGDRYRLVKRVGAGASGSVWLARDLERDIDVAVKVLASKHLASADVVARFVKEGELAARMLSPHIVRVLARGVSDDFGPYVVYEHLEGEDLETALATRRSLPLIDVRTVVVHTCRALGRAHALGILHRDVKPANIFIESDLDGRKVVKTIDFGVAEIVGNAHGDELVGTLEYIAPEVLFGECAPDARSDLYALAVVAYQCLTGRVPFRAGTIAQLVCVLAKGPPPPPSHLRSELSPEVDAWFAKALDRNPERRFGSAKDMADAINGLIEGMDHMPSSSRMPVFAGALRSASLFDQERVSVSTYSIVVSREPETPAVENVSSKRGRR
jgi:serine/threonine-protein kinase